VKTVLQSYRERSPTVRYTPSSQYASLLIVWCVAICAVYSVPSVAMADDPDAKEPTTVIEPADVFVHVTLVNKELEHLRFVMGRPKNVQPDLDVTNAAPQEFFFRR